MITGRWSPTRRGQNVRRALQVLLTTVAATAALAGCGGSDGPETVNGCVIEPSTSCVNVDLSGADLSGADLSRAVLSGANLEDADLSDANLSEASNRNSHIGDPDRAGADLTTANRPGATITGANLDGATLCGTTRTDGTVDDTSCPASTDTSTTDTTATTEATAAEVTSLDVGDLDCGAAATGPVLVSWETTAATAVEITVDGLSPSAFGPIGSTNVVVPCDGESHLITITPQNDSGPGEAESEEVSAS
jgi:hypothetical protein